MRKITTLFLVFLGIFWSGAGLSQQKTYYSVYCADEKIEISMNNLKQMKSARGSNTCRMQRFEYHSDALNYAEKMGGKGNKCFCK